MLNIGSGFLRMYNGSQNTECAVCPPSNKVAAMPEYAIANVIFSCDLIFARPAARGNENSDAGIDCEAN
ncbi:hypothetical protein TNCV_4679791 [Trichonephila clavipes]|nr:hypothetical protein TNCV_4679791 [Trichonephila clavipes]